MNALADFLAAVAADPDDVATREVFGDWLEQQGYEWLARFTRAAADSLKNPEPIGYGLCPSGFHVYPRSEGVLCGCLWELRDGKRCPACGVFKGHKRGCRFWFPGCS